MNDVFEQHPSETLDYTADFSGHCVRRRQGNTSYTLNTVVQPARHTGWQYRATTAGWTGAREPRWPTADTQTVQDGSVEWTTEAISTESLLRSLSSATWSADSGLTLGTETTAGTQSTMLISGGTLGQRYLVRIVGACSDGTAPVIVFWLTIKQPARVVA
jgi:hypothetical protein